MTVRSRDEQQGRIYFEVPLFPLGIHVTFPDTPCSCPVTHAAEKKDGNWYTSLYSQHDNGENKPHWD